jgi:exopolysaccharide/PEP-CTERM locus tyrosine autokinase
MPTDTQHPQEIAKKDTPPSKSYLPEASPPTQQAIKLETSQAIKPAKDFQPPIAKPGAKLDETAIDVNLISLRDPQSFEAEQFKILRTNLLFPVSGTAPQSILVTGALPGDGKSFVSANLAVSIALNINKHVLLIDCDLRKPDIHRMFGFGEVPGLSEYLMEHHDFESLLMKTSVDKLTLLPGGSVPPNPSELMSTERMSALIEEVRTRYHDRLIVLDSPPPALAAETVFLARYVDGIVLVVKQGSTPREEVEDLVKSLGSDKIIGCVINQLDMQISRYYGRKKYSKYGKRYYK